MQSDEQILVNAGALLEKISKKPVLVKAHLQKNQKVKNFTKNKKYDL